jgi:hypothetical protein
VGVAVGAAVGVAVGVGAGGPAWATADQTVTASARITRKPTTEGRIVSFDMVLPLMSEPRMGRNRPMSEASALKFPP